jgi:lactoylglutathione lyase
MSQRAFPLVFASSVTATAEFYERLGFTRHIQTPPSGEPTYIALRRDGAEVAVVGTGWPTAQYGGELGTGSRFEMFVVVDDVDIMCKQLATQGATVLSDPVDTPWGERVAHVTDPDGNPVALASSTAS